MIRIYFNEEKKVGNYLDAGSWHVNCSATFLKKLRRSRMDLSSKSSNDILAVGINFLGVAECLKEIELSLVDAIG